MWGGCDFSLPENEGRETDRGVKQRLAREGLDIGVFQPTLLVEGHQVFALVMSIKIGLAIIIPLIQVDMIK